MVGVHFKDENRIFGKPSSMTDDECYDLPCKMTTNGKFPAVESVWQLSDEEIAMIIKSKRIRLGIIGGGMPPTYIQVEPVDNLIPEPFKPSEEKCDGDLETRI